MNRLKLTAAIALAVAAWVFIAAQALIPAITP